MTAPAVAILLRARVRALRHDLRADALGERGAARLAVALLSLVAAAAAWSAHGLRALTTGPAVPLVFALVAAVLVTLGLRHGVESLALGGPWTLLRVMPVSSRTLLAVEFAWRLAPAAVVTAVVMGAAVVVDGREAGLGAGAVAAAAFVAVFLPLGPAGVGLLLAAFAARTFGAGRSGRAVGAASAALTLVFYSCAPLLFAYAGRTFGSWPAMVEATRALLPGSHGGTVTAAELSVSALLGAAAFAAALGSANRLCLRRGAPDTGRGERVVRRRTTPRFRAAAARKPAWAIAWAEVRRLRRDPTGRRQLVLPLLIMLGATVHQLAQGPHASTRWMPLSTAGWEGLPCAFLAAFVCLPMSDTLSRLLLREHERSFWIVRVAPVSEREYLLGRAAVVLLPFGAVGVPFTALQALHSGVPWTALASSLVVLLLLGIGTSSIGIGLGAAWTPRPDSAGWRGPLARGILPLSYLGYAEVIVFGWVGLSIVARAFPGAAGWLLVVGLSTTAVLAALVSRLALNAGARRLRRLDVG
jgi:hypothetical protein